MCHKLVIELRTLNKSKWKRSRNGKIFELMAYPKNQMEKFVRIFIKIMVRKIWNELQWIWLYMLGVLLTLRLEFVEAEVDNINLN